MPMIDTSTLRPGDRVEPLTQLQTYCGLDTMLTLEVFEEIIADHHLAEVREPGSNLEPFPTAYSYERALQGPLLEIMLRGFKINMGARRNALAELDAQVTQLERQLDRMAGAVWDRPLNARSPKQLIDFFYGVMRLPEVWISDKGQRKLSTNREALEKLELYLFARPLCATILAIRDLGKQAEALRTEVDPDGRMRTSYNIAGTESWRLSSSSNAFGSGGNLQNWSPALRRVFEADPGYKLCVIDYEQAESREVGWLLGVLFDDWTYLNACESGDLHTFTSKLIWPKLPWPGTQPGDRALADSPFYRTFTRRDMSKRGGHAITYYGTDFTISRHLKVPVPFITDFRKGFFGAFPGIPRWHRWVAQEIQTKQCLVTPFGQTRHFFGRATDDTTLREAIAFAPQSATALRTNIALWRLWQGLGSKIHLLAQTHDSITFQFLERDEPEVIPQALQLMELWFEHKGRRMTVPGDPKVGWNWANAGKAPAGGNPEGLVKWCGPGTDKRTRAVGLDRRF